MLVTLPCRLEPDSVCGKSKHAAWQDYVADNFTRSNGYFAHSNIDEANDSYYDRWSKVYRYAPTSLTDLDSSFSFSFTPSSSSLASSSRSCLSTTMSATADADQTSSEEQQHELKMGRLHAKREGECVYARAKADLPVESDWETVYDYILRPFHPDKLQFARDMWLKLFRAAQECVGMRAEYVGTAMTSMERFWQHTQTQLVPDVRRLRFQCNKKMLGSTDVTDGMDEMTLKRCGRWNVVLSSTIVGQMPRTTPHVLNVASRLNLFVTGLDQPTLITTGFLGVAWNAENVASGTYFLAHTDAQSLFSLLTPHLPILAVARIILNDYSGITILDDADTRLEPSFVSNTFFS
jgi:hypothetical protein